MVMVMAMTLCLVPCSVTIDHVHVHVHALISLCLLLPSITYTLARKNAVLRMAHLRTYRSPIYRRSV